MRKLHVNLGKNSYDIVFERGLLSDVGRYIKRDGKKLCVITDDNVAAVYADKVVSSLEKAGYTVSLCVLPHGEKTKAFDTLPGVYSKLIEDKITRKDALVALGGGVIGDLCGFVAATYLRGIGFIQIPTSLLAQVDSSIGGKVAVDMPEGKNLVGAFYQPETVLIDADALNTLSPEFFTDGMAEVIKYGCIKDKKLFAELDACGGKEGLLPVIDDVIYRCCDIKREVVEKDEKDKGDRMLLNFGHTYGHALEKYYNYEKISHGAAVAVGMRTICSIAERKGLTAKGCADKITALCNKYGLSCRDDAPYDEVVGAIASDKKNLNGALKVVLLRDVGDGYVYPTDGGFWL